MLVLPYSKQIRRMLCLIRGARNYVTEMSVICSGTCVLLEGLTKARRRGADNPCVVLQKHYTNTWPNHRRCFPCAPITDLANPAVFAQSMPTDEQSTPWQPIRRAQRTISKPHAVYEELYGALYPDADIVALRVSGMLPK